MNKVIIVEDDRIIRNGLCKTIPWEANGFYVAGDAGDGEMALKLIEHEQPQVVISDINMPFMNGLEMAKLVKKKSPHTRIIFLTGYEEFSYAQEAIKLKAYDYLLKPVDSEQLLRKVKEAANESSEELIGQKKLHDSLPFLQQSFIQKLIQGKRERIDVEEELFNLGIHLEGNYYSSMLLYFNERSKLSEISHIENIVEKYFPKNRGAVLNGGEHEIAVFLSGHGDISALIIKLAESLLTLKEDHDSSITITLGRVYENLFELGKSYFDCRLAMNMKHIRGEQSIYSINDISNCQSSTERVEQLDIELEDAIKMGLPEKVDLFLVQLQEALYNSMACSLQELKALSVKYSSLLFYEIEKWEKEDMEKFNFSRYYKELSELRTLSDMFTLLHRLVEEWSMLMDKRRQNNRYTLVDQAIEYMKDQFCESGLTLQKVADHIHVSSPYLSNLFKVEKGFNFGECLLDLRMKKAMEIIREESCKTYEVSEQVGYSNPQYFSICFKKYTGYTPAEYRKKYG